MIYASKGNRVRQISESEIDTFAERGYEISDGTGTVLKETVPTDVPTLKLAYVNHIKEIAELKAEIEQLKKPAKTETKKSATKKSEEVSE